MSGNPDMLSSLDEVVRRLSSEAASSATLPEAREAALSTGGVPVFADVGGVFVLAVDGTILYYDYDLHTARPEEDHRWRTLALVHAARNFTELRLVAPVRSEFDINCSECNGEGTLFGFDCGRCFGTGWHRGSNHS